MGPLPLGKPVINTISNSIWIIILASYAGCSPMKKIDTDNSAETKNSLPVSSSIHLPVMHHLQEPFQQANINSYNDEQMPVHQTSEWVVGTVRSMAGLDLCAN